MDDLAAEAVRRLILGTAPEKSDEILDLFKRINPNIRLSEDISGFSLEAGAYDILKYNHKSMSMIWILGFAIQKAFIRYSGCIIWSNLQHLEIGTDSLEELAGEKCICYNVNALISHIKSLQYYDNIDQVQWPHGIPFTNNLKPANVQGKMAFDLLIMAAAFTFLHELRHIEISQKNISFSPADEEFECDQFARNVIFESAAQYADLYHLPIESVIEKRAMGCSIILLFMLIVTPVENLNGSQTHPSVFDRINRITSELSLSENSSFWVYFSCGLYSFADHCNIRIPLETCVTYKRTAEHILRQIKDFASTPN